MSDANPTGINVPNSEILCIKDKLCELESELEAKDLKGKKVNAINVDEKATAQPDGTQLPTYNPYAGASNSNNETVGGDVAIAHPDNNGHDNTHAVDGALKDTVPPGETVEDSKEASINESSAGTTPPNNPAKKPTRWMCDFCNEAIFNDYDKACEHEKTCDKNTDWCIVHFDSGKHFKLHKTTEITGNIRKYLNAYYEAEYASTHPGITSFNTKNMPSFTATGLPQQDNTKDCGVFMLENAEKMLRATPTIDYEFVNKTKGITKQKFFGDNDYDKTVIEKKRDDILQLAQTMIRGGGINEVL